LNTIYDRATKGDELCIRLWQELRKESLRRAKKLVKGKNVIEGMITGKIPIDGEGQ
jgi:hypothetical protein